MSWLDKLFGHTENNEPQTQEAARHYNPMLGRYEPGPDKRTASASELYNEMRRQDNKYGTRHEEHYSQGQNIFTDWFDHKFAHDEYAKHGYIHQSRRDSGHDWTAELPMDERPDYDAHGRAANVDPDEVGQFYADHHHGIHAADYAAADYWDKAHGYK